MRKIRKMEKKTNRKRYDPQILEKNMKPQKFKSITKKDKRKR